MLTNVICLCNGVIMCIRCEGYGEEQVGRMHDLMIDVHGFAITQVREHGQYGWTYTMGLREGLDHPDLLVVQLKPDVQAELASKLGQMVVDDGRLDPEVLAVSDIELVPVDPRHFRDGLVAEWVNRYHKFPEEGDFLQVMMGPSMLCECCQHRMQRLDDPAPLRLHHKNRQQRRAEQRHRPKPPNGRRR